MVKLVNRAKMTTTTTGTGPLVPGTAVAGYQSFSAAGMVDNDIVRYVIEDGLDWEIGYGTYLSGFNVLYRDLIESSTGSLLNLSGSAVVYISATEADFREEQVGDISGTTLDLSTGTVFSHAPASNSTYVFSNPPASGVSAYGFTLKVTPSATVTITWPASVDWPSGTAPTAPASGTTSVFVFYSQDGGTTYYGFVAGEGMA